MKLIIDRITIVEGCGEVQPGDEVDVSPEIAEILMVNGDAHPKSPILRPDNVRVTPGDSNNG